MGSTVKGVGVDKDAESKHDPVTVVVTPAGHDLDADTWSDANNYVAAGCAFKEGYPTFPGDEPTGRPSSSRPGQAPSAPASGSSSSASSSPSSNPAQSA